MNTPIADFLKVYAGGDPIRAHMPGHKGLYPHDITEIHGADSLYDASGIIAQSEQNASQIFGAHTFYSTEGSSLCIRAMLWLVRQRAGRPVTVLAGRNAHKTFVSACAFLDVNVRWLYGDSYLSCNITPNDVRECVLRDGAPDALYITSPDYLGSMQDIAGISAVCRELGVMLLVDNAHGAYLKLLDAHPIDLGADICCDSAHKTLPVLTGGAYLHIRDGELARCAKTALSLFGSTSPSYLILESLDRVNEYLVDHRERVAMFSHILADLKRSLEIEVRGDEPFKLTLAPKSYGYTGYQLAEYLEGRGIFCEFADPDHLVMMLTPENTDDLSAITDALSALQKRTPITDAPPRLSPPERVTDLKTALLSPYETLPAHKCIGRVAAAVTVGCPPAVPIVVSGERITKAAVAAFEYYGIESVNVIKNADV